MSDELAIENAPRRIRRWAKRPTNPNDVDPNAFLSVRDVQLIIRELENHACRIAMLRDRASRAEQRHVKKLVEKLRQVRWS